MKLYEIIEEAFQAQYRKVKAESNKVMEGFRMNVVCKEIILHVRSLDNHQVRRVPFDLKND